MNSSALREIFLLLNRLLGVPVTFIDPKGAEIDIPGLQHSEYCRKRRCNKEFKDKCNACDCLHIEEAARSRETTLYRCHDGLIEGIVPLHNQNGDFLGSIMFGQLRGEGDAPRDDLYQELRILYGKSPAVTMERACDIGRLLRYVAEHILGNEMLRWQSYPWANRLREYIHEHPGEPLRIADLAAMIGRSPGFISKHFPEAFGLPPRQYIRQVRLEQAARMLGRGETIANTAATLGFYDAFHFSKAFKSYWLLTPSEYQNRQSSAE